MSRLICLLLLLSLSMTACGVSGQDHPVAVGVQPATGAEPPPEEGAMAVELYFVRGSHLARVERAATSSSVQTALDLLVAGPSRAEVGSGIRTALAPQPLTVADGRAPQTLVVAATRDFTSVSGGNQLLAVAQLVWTATALPGVERVRVTVEGATVEVPTDEGLTRQSVRREDYASVAPPPTPTPTPSRSPTPTTAPGTTTAPAPPTS